MPQEINPSVKIIKNYPVDERAMFWDGASYRPYTDVAEANASIISSKRYVGLMVRIASGWHEYKTGITNSDLVPFTSASTGGGKMAIKVNGLAGSPVADSFTFQNNSLKGKTVIDILVNKTHETLIDGDFTFDSVAGEITRTNMWTAGDTCIIYY